MFGSIVYRRSALAGLRIADDTFATLADRPFLLEILARWSGAVIRDPLTWYRKHDDTDRHLAMNAGHILRLFTAYRAAFAQQWSREDRALFYGYTGYWLFTLYHLVPPEARANRCGRSSGARGATVCTARAGRAATAGSG